MRKTIILVIILLCIIPLAPFKGGGDVLALSPKRFGRILNSAVGGTGQDTAWNVDLGTDKGMRKRCMVTVKNTSATLTDTLQWYDLIAGYDGLTEDTVQHGFKIFSVNSQAVENDTIYTALSIAPSTEMEVMLWKPYPEKPRFDLHNVEYNSARTLAIKPKFYVE